MPNTPAEDADAFLTDILDAPACRRLEVEVIPDREELDGAEQPVARAQRLVSTERPQEAFQGGLRISDDQCAHCR